MYPPMPYTYYAAPPVGGRVSAANHPMASSNGPIPFYMAYPYSVQMQENQEDEKDMDRIKDMFPRIARTIQPIIEEECDKMEYDGSLMFDIYPDKLMMENLISRVYNLLPKSKEEKNDKDEIFATDCTVCSQSVGDAVKDLISVMLFQEMHRRRCRHRRCKKWW